MWPNLNETEDLVIFTNEILDQKFHFYAVKVVAENENELKMKTQESMNVGAYYVSEVKPHFIYFSLCIFGNVLVYQSWLWLIDWFFIKLCRSMNAKIHLEPIVSTVPWVFTYYLMPFLRLKNFPKFRCFPQTILV